MENLRLAKTTISITTKNHKLTTNSPSKTITKHLNSAKPPVKAKPLPPK
jgi:hypothetical protein